MSNHQKNKFFNNTLVIAALLLIIAGMLFVFVPISSDIITQVKLQNFGTALIISGIISIILDSIALKSIAKKLSKILFNNVRELKIRDFGISEVIERLPYNQLYSALTYSKSFDIVQTWVPNLSPFLQHAENMFSNKGTIRIFLLHPESSSAKQRSLDLNKIDGNLISNKIETDIRDVKSFYEKMRKQQNLSKEEMQKRLQLKLYATLPTCSIHKIDRKTWIGFYWLGIQSDETMTIAISGNEGNNKALKICNHQIEELDGKSIQVDLDSDDIPSLQSVMEQARM